MSDQVSRAITFYEDILDSHSDDLAAIHDAFTAECTRRKLTFGGRPVFNFLRPNFLSTHQYDEIQIVCLHLRNAITKFKYAAFGDPAIMSQAGILEGERSLVEIDPGYDRLSISARWDSFMQSDGNIKFVELNAESPAGIAYSDLAADVYRNLPFVKAFAKRYAILDWNVRKTLLRELLATYAVFRGNKKRQKPHIAIVDWNDVPTYTEFELFCEFFKSEGYECTIVDPRELEYANGVLTAGGFEIDLVYKRILTNDCVEKPAETRALVDACRGMDICLINPFRAKIVHKKSVFAVLTHEKNEYLFNRAELSVVRKHIPWTRVITEEKTIYRGRNVDLVDYIASHKDDFVIKPNDEYGGKGVTLGKEATTEAWNAAINDALNGEPFVVQEIVELPRVRFPRFVNGSLQYENMVVDLDPYVFGQKVDGVLTRLSSSSLANVTAGGGTTPTFVIHPMEEKRTTRMSLPTKSASKSTRKRVPASKRKTGAGPLKAGQQKKIQRTGKPKK